MIDLSDLVTLHSYVEQFHVSKHFRYLAEELEDLIKKDSMEHFSND